MQPNFMHWILTYLFMKTPGHYTVLLSGPVWGLLPTGHHWCALAIVPQTWSMCQERILVYFCLLTNKILTHSASQEFLLFRSSERSSAHDEAPLSSRWRDDRSRVSGKVGTKPQKSTNLKSWLLAHLFCSLFGGQTVSVLDITLSANCRS